LQGVGPFYWDDANALKQSGYGLVNLRLGLESEHLDLIFWGKNVLGKDYQCVSFGFLGTDALAQAGDPRTFGVTLRAKFYSN
jgi:iron complex outermembrane receptor protein